MGTPRFVIEDSDAEQIPPAVKRSTLLTTKQNRMFERETGSERTKQRRRREAEIHEAAVALAAEMTQRQSIGGRIVTPAPTVVPPAAAVSRLPEVPVVTASEDLPTLLVEETKKRVKDGSAKVQVRDGIAAQSILERRAERAEDKQFMLNLARALAGGGASGPVPVLAPGEPIDVTPDDVIDGDFTDLDDDTSLAPAHLRQTVE